MDTKRGFQIGRILLAAAVLASAVAGCRKGDPVDPGATGDVTRYSGAEVIESGQVSIRQSVQARTGAEWSSSSVAMLYPGTMVNRVARYGNYSLVSWNGGAQQGWVDATVAFGQRTVDAGTLKVNPAIVQRPPGPVVPTTPPPPQPTTQRPATPPPPPATTAPRPPPPPVPAPPLPPPTPATAKGKGFKPPSKVGN